MDRRDLLTGYGTGTLIGKPKRSVTPWTSSGVSRDASYSMKILSSEEAILAIRMPYTLVNFEKLSRSRSSNARDNSNDVSTFVIGNQDSTGMCHY